MSKLATLAEALEDPGVLAGTHIAIAEPRHVMDWLGIECDDLQIRVVDLGRAAQYRYRYPKPDSEHGSWRTTNPAAGRPLSSAFYRSQLERTVRIVEVPGHVSDRP